MPSATQLGAQQYCPEPQLLPSQLTLAVAPAPPLPPPEPELPPE
ncbi:MAG: LytR family transcriptional regulator, partial [Sorangiineae bacterium PRO1]|nr:LytR family transcriptional regulator [Sorangiineae bacterium PRO1]